MPPEARRSALAPRRVPVRSTACSARRRQQAQSVPERPNQSRPAPVIDAGTRSQRPRAPQRRPGSPPAAMSRAAQAPVDLPWQVSLRSEPARPKVPPVRAPSSQATLLAAAFQLSSSHARRSWRRPPATLRSSSARFGPLEAGESALPRPRDTARHVPADFPQSSAIPGSTVTKSVRGLSIRWPSSVDPQRIDAPRLALAVRD